MSKFYVNNSSFPYLACSRQYYFRVVKGLKQPPGGNKYTPLGLAFHEVMKGKAERTIGNVSLDLILEVKNSTNIPPLMAKLPAKASQIQIAMMADRVFDENQPIYADCKAEYEFVTACADDTATAPDALRAGTIDLLSFDASADRLDIIDYKTTSKPIDGNLMRNYKLSSQRFFYLSALYDIADTLPAHYADAIRNHRVGFRYCYVSMEKPEYVLEPPSLVDLTELHTFRKLFQERIILAQALHDDHSLAVPEGILSGLCWKCPFAPICAGAYTEDSWPYGQAPYTHKHDNE